MEIRIILSILFIHWVADFIFQTDEMARNKSTSNAWLFKHAIAYTGGLMLCWLLIATVSFSSLFHWIWINGATHFCVDYVTSRVSSRYYQKGNIHRFFIVVGFDQFVHAATLLITYGLMVE